MTILCPFTSSAAPSSHVLCFLPTSLVRPSPPGLGLGAWCTAPPCESATLSTSSQLRALQIPVKDSGKLLVLMDYDYL